MVCLLCILVAIRIASSISVGIDKYSHRLSVPSEGDAPGKWIRCVVSGNMHKVGQQMMAMLVKNCLQGVIYCVPSRHFLPMLLR